MQVARCNDGFTFDIPGFPNLITYAYRALVGIHVAQSQDDIIIIAFYRNKIFVVMKYKLITHFNSTNLFKIKQNACLGKRSRNIRYYFNVKFNKITILCLRSFENLKLACNLLVNLPVHCYLIAATLYSNSSRNFAIESRTPSCDAYI